MEDKKIVLNVSGNEANIREGKLADPLPLREPKAIHLTGDIKTIAHYVHVRQDTAQGLQIINPATVVVEVDKNARKIVMSLDPENFYGSTITAKLEMSEELRQFGINTTTRYSRKDLTNLLKFNRLFFEDKNQHAEVLAGLMKVRFLSQTEMEQANDNKGNRKDSKEVSTTTHEGFKDKFILSIPIFKGFDKQQIEVEICFDVLNGDISFWLESVGLKEATDSQIDDIFEKQLECCSDYVVIYK